MTTTPDIDTINANIDAGMDMEEQLAKELLAETDRYCAALADIAARAPGGRRYLSPIRQAVTSIMVPVGTAKLNTLPALVQSYAPKVELPVPVVPMPPAATAG